MPKDSIIPLKICFYGNTFGQVIFVLNMTHIYSKIRGISCQLKLNANKFFATVAIPNLRGQ